MADKTFMKQVNPATGTWTDVYISSAYGVITNMTLCNTGAAPVNYTLALCPLGVTTATSSYFFPSQQLAPYEVFENSSPRGLSATDVLRVCCTSSTMNVLAHILEYGS